MVQNLPQKPIKQTPGIIALGIFGFVVVPGLITAMAPVSYIRMEQRPGGVHASYQQCMWFVVPYAGAELFPVQAIESSVVAARQRNAEERRRNGGKNATIEGDGTLIFIGPDDGKIEVQVSPASIKQIEEQAQQFLQAPTAQPLTLFAPANWKVSVFAGGAATFFTVLYLVGSAIALPLWLFKKLTRLGPEPVDADPSLETR